MSLKELMMGIIWCFVSITCKHKFIDNSWPEQSLSFTWIFCDYVASMDKNKPLTLIPSSIYFCNISKPAEIQAGSSFQWSKSVTTCSVLKHFPCPALPPVSGKCNWQKPSSCSSSLPLYCLSADTLITFETERGGGRERVISTVCSS